MLVYKGKLAANKKGHNSSLLTKLLQVPSYPRWILFLHGSTSVDNFLNGIDIPFDCEFLVAEYSEDHRVELTEVFRVEAISPLSTDPYGNWTQNGGLNITTLKLYARRDNLQGIVIKVSTLPVSPWFCTEVGHMCFSDK